MLRPPTSLYSGRPQTSPVIPVPHLEEIAKHPYNVGNWLPWFRQTGKRDSRTFSRRLKMAVACDEHGAGGQQTCAGAALCTRMQAPINRLRKILPRRVRIRHEGTHH